MTAEASRKFNLDGSVALENFNMLGNRTDGSFPGYNVDELTCLFGAEALTIDLTRVMLCSGVLGGGGRSLRIFLRRYAIHLLRVGGRKCKRRWIPDQMILNFMAGHGEVPNLVVTTNEDGPVLHSAPQLLRVRKQPVFEITNEHATAVAAVVHHIDRSPELLKKVAVFVDKESNREITRADVIDGLWSSATTAGERDSRRFELLMHDGVSCVLLAARILDQKNLL